MSGPALFALPPEQRPIEAPAEQLALTADVVKQALRRHHPGDDQGSMVGQWTCIEEWRGIDLLALNAWQKADVIGYEVKISRSDLRRELLKPHKRADALARTTEFYLAVPDGLLMPEEIAYEEPEWAPEDFDRETCAGVEPFGPEYKRERWGYYGPITHPYGGRCHRSRSRRANVVTVPMPVVETMPDWLTQRDDETPESFRGRALQHFAIAAGDHRVPCWTCGGKGYTAKSRVEREAPTCWVPADVGLVTISARGVRVVKRSPKRKDPKPIAVTRQQINDLVRWVSHRPDPRHRSVA